MPTAKHLRGLTPFLLLLVAACSSPRQGLIPTPVVYQDQRVQDLYRQLPPEQQNTELTVYYGTDRAPSGPVENRRYGIGPGGTLRVGIGQIRIGNEDLTWQELRERSLENPSEYDIPMYLLAAREYGVPSADATAARTFVNAINADLAQSPVKRIVLFVHGSLVNFERPLFIAAGLHHFMARNGVMVAFCWRTKEGTISYPGDVRRSRTAIVPLVELIELLATRTDVEEINIISWSAGGPIVAEALSRLREAHSQLSAEQVRRKFRVDAVIFAASDVDLKTFTDDFLERMYDIPREIIVTVSRNDAILNISQWWYGRSRIGDPDPSELSRQDLEVLAARMDDKLTVVDVTEAIEQRGAGDEQGHGYWFRNDWVSSDILAALAWDLPPHDRGLERHPGKYAYHFPPDYPQRIADLLVAISAERARERASATTP